MTNRTKRNKSLINFSFFGIILGCILMFISCSESFYQENRSTPVESGYGLIRVNFIGEGSERTVLPSIAFSKYEYTFSKAGGNSEEITPDNSGFFALEIGYYTVAVKAYTGNEGSYTLVADGVSSQFTVDSGNNASVEVRLSSVNTAEKGQFSYTITYPTGASAEVNLLNWSDNNYITLNPVTQVNGNSQILQLEQGSYLLTILIKKDGLYAGVSEAIHINSSITTEYTKQFNDDDLLVARTPLSSDYNISGTGTFLYDGNQRSVIVTPKVNASSGAITIYYEGTGDTIYPKSTTAPTNIGMYNITIDVEAVSGWSGAIGLPVGTISITIPVISINTHPISGNLTVGSISGNLSVSASVTQGASLSYQWYSNNVNSNSGGTVINGATGSSYTIPTTLTAGTYYYFVEIKATGGAVSVHSNVATVTVASAPVITISTQPSSRSVTAGSISGSLSIAASVTQSATLSYQWYSNTTNSNSGGTAISGATGSSYTIPTTLAAGTYYYFVEVRATGGATAVRSSVASVTVSAPAAFIVNSVETLRKVGTGQDGWTLSAHYKQTADITLPTPSTGQSNHVPIGTYDDGYTLLSDIFFTGSYDGGGFAINNLVINTPNNDYVGLFGAIRGNGISTGVLKNIRLVGGSITGRDYVGSVVGLLNTFENNTTVQDCNTSVSVYGRNYIGGIIGSGTSFASASSNSKGTVQNCYSTGDVNGTDAVGGVAGNIRSAGGAVVKYCYSTGNINGTGTGSVGGVVGSSTYGIIQFCYSTGTITSNGSAGGIEGSGLYSIIQNCYSTGNITGVYFTGGISGGTQSEIHYCYSTSSIKGGNGNYDNAGGISIGGAILNSVALNNNISGSRTGRISPLVNDSYVANNYARSDMLVNGGGVSTTGIQTIHGGSISVSASTTQSSVFNGWDSSVWNISGYLTVGATLPTLRNMPAGTQNPKLP